MGKITRTWALMGASWQVLKQDKEILWLPFISGICCLLVMATFALPFVLTSHWQPPSGKADLSAQIIYYGTLFLFYCCNYFVIVFFQSAIVACASIRLNGGNPTMGDGIRAAGERLPMIIGWSVLSATVGLILRIIEDRSEKIGQIIAGLFGIGWSLASFLVIPILVVEGKGPFTALKESTLLLKKTWGEQVIGNVSFGLVFGILGIPAFALIFVGIFVFMPSSGKVGIIVCITLAALYLMALSAIQSALQAIYLTALYQYAKDGQVPAGFDAEMMSGAMVQR